MDYNQPYGAAANASYVNGDPSTGTAGSIPPAAAIEYPQREIVAAIADAGLTPDNADRTQLAQAIQSGVLSYGNDVGTAGAVAVTLSPAPVNYPKLIVVKKSNAANPGPVTIAINALPVVAVLSKDGAALQPGDWAASHLAILIYNGSSAYQIVAGFSTALSSNLDYYVNNATGLDSNTGLSAGAAFRSINHAIQVATAINLNGYTVTIHVADGTYAENVELSLINGNGSIVIVGNEVTPANVLIQPATGPAIHWGGTFATYGYFLRGLKLATVADGALAAHCIYGGGGLVFIRNMEFGSCPQSHMFIQSGTLVIDGVGDGASGAFIRVTGSPVGDHMLVTLGGLIQMFQPALVIPGAITCARWAEAKGKSTIFGTYASLTGSANVTAGTKYNVTQNSLIDVSGSGAGYFPGPTAGTSATGGQYT